jgi:hypothetical protein
MNRRIFWRYLCAVVLLAGTVVAAGRASAQTLQPLSPGFEPSVRSVNSNTPTSVEFVNLTSQTVDIYWLDFEGDRVHYASLPSRQSYIQPTYFTHPWVVTTRQGMGIAIFQPIVGLARAIVTDDMVRTARGSGAGNAGSQRISVELTGYGWGAFDGFWYYPRALILIRNTTNQTIRVTAVRFGIAGRSSGEETLAPGEGVEPVLVDRNVRGAPGAQVDRGICFPGRTAQVRIEVDYTDGIGIRQFWKRTVVWRCN